MVAPENDDSVVAIGRGFEAVEQAADLGVAEGDAGEVGLDEFFPAAGLQDLGVVAIALGHFDAGGRNIIQVILAMGRQLDGFEGELVEPLGRNGEGQVWLGETDGEEEWLVVFLFEFFECVGDDCVVGHFFVGDW